jgi:tetratricopeptide (TPR) repeat protein
LKWMLTGLTLAALMIGAGFLLTDNGTNMGFSSNTEAIDLCDKGSDEVQAFKFKEGARNLEAALELDPSLAEAAISLSYAYARMGLGDKYKKTLALADSLTLQIEDDDRRMVAQMRLAVRHRSRFSGMLDSLMVRLEEEQPKNIHVMFTRAELLSMRGETEQEYEAWHHLLEINPNFAEAYNRLGYFEMYRGNYSLAIEHMKKYSFLAPDLANPHDSLGDVLMVIGEYEDAAVEFRAAISIQPDFYYSYLNLGKTLLYRGMNQSGFEIMEKVENMVAGSKLGVEVDQRLMEIYHEMDLQQQVAQLSKSYVERYPDQHMAPYYRAIRLVHMNRFDESQALMDSTLAVWRSSKGYRNNPKEFLSIDIADKSYQAYLSDLVDQPSTRVRLWKNLVAIMNEKIPAYKQSKARLKLAAAHLDNGDPLLAREQIYPILEMNNRLVPALVLAVKTDLALRDAANARVALEQLKWSIQQSDEDYSGREQAALLEDQVIELEGNS